ETTCGSNRPRYRRQPHERHRCGRLPPPCRAGRGHRLHPLPRLRPRPVRRPERRPGADRGRCPEPRCELRGDRLRSLGTRRLDAADGGCLVADRRDRHPGQQRRVLHSRRLGYPDRGIAGPALRRQSSRHGDADRGIRSPLHQRHGRAGRQFQLRSAPGLDAERTRLRQLEGRDHCLYAEHRAGSGATGHHRQRDQPRPDRHRLDVRRAQGEPDRQHAFRPHWSAGGRRPARRLARERRGELGHRPGHQLRGRLGPRL
ncbi:MAG: 3-oxoacyl-[acyl-carrier protein] reductase, partial [uncultured Thermomicrobiales bacterium]